jgi:hypothetical protein
MGILIEPCELHEITNCSICTGLDKMLAAEQAPSYAAEVGRVAGLPPGHRRAQWDGSCKSCGTEYDAGEVIRFSKTADGWVGIGCC